LTDMHIPIIEHDNVRSMIAHIAHAILVYPHVAFLANIN
jgi:hypothetical protein